MDTVAVVAIRIQGKTFFYELAHNLERFCIVIKYRNILKIYSQKVKNLALWKSLYLEKFSYSSGAILVKDGSLLPQYPSLAC